jgi:hypothetical protein
VLHRYRNGLADEAGGAAREPMEVVEDLTSYVVKASLR